MSAQSHAVRSRPRINIVLEGSNLSMAILTKASLCSHILKVPPKLAPTLLLHRMDSYSRLFCSKFSTQSHHRKQISLSNLFQRFGFPPDQLPKFLSRNHTLLNNLVLHEVEKSLSILSSWKIAPDLMVAIVIECPGVLDLEFLQKWNLVFESDLEHHSVSCIGLVNAVKLCARLQLAPDGLLENLAFLKDLGFGDATVRKVLEEFPRVVTLKRSEISQKVEFLERIGVPRNAIDRILFKFTGILGLGFEDRLKPLYLEFKNLGFNNCEIVEEIVREPKILSMELGELSRCLELLQSLKCREAVIRDIFSDGPFRAGFEVKLRVDCLCRHGLIRREAFKVLWKEPRVIVYSIEEIEQKIEFLIHHMKYKIECLIDVPEYLGVNFEKQIIPRYNVIKYLDSIGGLGDPVMLRDLIKPSRLRFYNMYVKPYPDCEKLYGRYVVEKSKNRHPSGLWKLFKPKKYPDSIDDVRNMRSFMKTLN